MPCVLRRRAWMSGKGLRSGYWKLQGLVIGEDLRDDPRPIYVWDKMFYSPYTNGYCIYCNTTVAMWDCGSLRGFRHNHYRGGMRQELCKQIAGCVSPGQHPVRCCQRVPGNVRTRAEACVHRGRASASPTQWNGGRPDLNTQGGQKWASI